MLVLVFYSKCAYHAIIPTSSSPRFGSNPFTNIYYTIQRHKFHESLTIGARYITILMMYIHTKAGGTRGNEWEKKVRACANSKPITIIYLKKKKYKYVCMHCNQKRYNREANKTNETRWINFWMEMWHYTSNGINRK